MNEIAAVLAATSFFTSDDLHSLTPVNTIHYDEQKVIKI